MTCAHCEHTYAHRRNLTYHMKSKHPDVSVERKVRGAGKKVKTGLGFKCDQCGYLVTERMRLARHVARNHTDNPAFNCDQRGRSYSRSGNLEMHKRTCTGAIVAPAPKMRRTASAFPEFTVRRNERSLGGTSEMYEVDMKESDNLTALQAAVTSFQPSMSTYQRDHSAYKFQMAVDVIFHKAVDPTALILTSEMVAVYGAPPLEDINRQQLNLVEIYEHNGSGWVCPDCASLQLTL